MHMKKLFVLLMALGFFVSACNNNKTGKNQNTNNRDKDDYGKNDKMNNADENKTNDNSGNSTWTETEKTKILKDCVASFDESQSALANQICPCLLGKMEEKYTSFNDADTRSSEAEIKSFTLQCKDEVSGNNGNNNNSMTGGWSGNDINEFVSTCVSSAVQQGMSQDLSQKYCSCMQQKLEQMFPDPKDAGNITEEQMNTPSMQEIAKRCLTGN